MRKIEISLSESGIDKAIQAIDDYAKQLASKNEIFVQKLCEAGIPVIEQAINGTVGDSNTNHYTHVDLRHYQDYSSATLVVEGQDILFIEFGAGVHFNTAVGTSPHELGEELGYTIGSYGKGLGANDSWYYVAETGETVRSYGTKASMPLFLASKEIRQQLRQIAKEVYGNG